LEDGRNDGGLIRGNFFRERKNEKEGYYRKIAIPRSPGIAHAFLCEEKSEFFCAFSSGTEGVGGQYNKILANDTYLMAVVK
jgi:hypothetical protein